MRGVKPRPKSCGASATKITPPLRQRRARSPGPGRWQTPARGPGGRSPRPSQDQADRRVRDERDAARNDERDPARGVLAECLEQAVGSRSRRSRGPSARATRPCRSTNPPTVYAGDEPDRDRLADRVEDARATRSSRSAREATTAAMPSQRSRAARAGDQAELVVDRRQLGLPALEPRRRRETAAARRGARATPACRGGRARRARSTSTAHTTPATEEQPAQRLRHRQQQRHERRRERDHAPARPRS